MVIRAITREVHYTLSCSSIDIEDTVHTCLTGVGDRFDFVFSALVCLFLRLFMCVIFRVSLVFMSTSLIVSVYVYFYVSVYWGFPDLVYLKF